MDIPESMTVVPTITYTKAVHETTWGKEKDTYPKNTSYQYPIGLEYFAPPGSLMHFVTDESGSFYVLSKQQAEQKLHQDEYVAESVADFNSSRSAAAGVKVTMYITNVYGMTKGTTITFNRVSA